MEKFEEMPENRDVSTEFGSLPLNEFRNFLKELRTVSQLEINADLSSISDPNEFRIKARQIKVFLESKPNNQKRKASVKATREQIGWEPNVFSSGVEFIEE